MRGLPGITRIFTIRTALDIFKRPNQRRFLSDNIYHSVHSPPSESYQTFQEKNNNHPPILYSEGELTTSDHLSRTYVSYVSHVVPHEKA